MIANPGGSGGTVGFFDGQERRHRYDPSSGAAAQPRPGGNAGTIGSSYFAMTQLEAAVEQPPKSSATANPWPGIARPTLARTANSTRVAMYPSWRTVHKVTDLPPYTRAPTKDSPVATEHSATLLSR